MSQEIALLLALAGCLGEAAIIYTVIILTRLSQKLGAVTKMRSYYHGFYVSLGFLSLSLASRLVRISNMVTAPQHAIPLLGTEPFYLFTHHLPMVLGMLLAVAIAAKYWGWLMKE